MEIYTILLAIFAVIIIGVLFFVYIKYTSKDKILTLKQELFEKDTKIKELEDKIKSNEDIKSGFEKEYTQKLYNLAQSTPEKVKYELRNEVENSIYLDLEKLQKKLINNIKEGANQKAIEIIALAIQRCSSKVTNEHTGIVLKIEDEDKGKLIGKGGRNIQWFEKTLGVELVIDDTPGMIILSGYSSVRKFLAKKTIEKILVDGRVNPSLIEEYYNLSVNEMDKEMEQAGQDVVDELGIIDFDIRLIRLIGRLKFRTSFGQSILSHSLEMAKLAGLIVDNINAEFVSSKPINKSIAIKGALLHDIGKSIDEEMTPKGNHIEIGEKICDMFKLDWRIKKCISSHHTTGGEYSNYFNKELGEFCVEACIVDACDSISGGRIGARKEEDKNFDQRVKALEEIAKQIEGVGKSWVMKGAKELWVFFDAQDINSKEVRKKVKEIANLINEKIKTPSEIKVIGIREDRIVEYSR